MKIVNLKYFDVLEINESCPETLVIENPQLLRNMLEELIYQEETDDGEFYLSDIQQKPLTLSKNLMLISDIFHFQNSAKPLKSKINALISSEYSDIEEKEHLLEQLNEVGIKICNEFPYQITFKNNLSFMDIVKMFDFSLDITEGSFWERFVEFVSACFDLLGYRLLVTVNLKEYISKEEYKELIKSFSYRNIPILMIESRQYSELDDINHLHIIDQDLCVL